MSGAHLCLTCQPLAHCPDDAASDGAAGWVLSWHQHPQSQEPDGISDSGLCQPFAGVLPQHVLEPGSVVGPVTAAAAGQYSLAEDCVICAGTTGDSADLLFDTLPCLSA